MARGYYRHSVLAIYLIIINSHSVGSLAYWPAYPGAGLIRQVLNFAGNLPAVQRHSRMISVDLQDPKILALHAVCMRYLGNFVQIELMRVPVQQAMTRIIKSRKRISRPGTQGVAKSVPPSLQSDQAIGLTSERFDSKRGNN